MMHKIVNCQAPFYLTKISEKQIGSTVYDLRSSNNIQLQKVRTKSYYDGFGVSGPIIWNSLLDSLKNEKSLSKFKKEIRNHNFCIDNININMQFFSCIYCKYLYLINKNPNKSCKYLVIHNTASRQTAELGIVVIFISDRTTVFK